VEASEQLQAFTRSVLCDVHVQQLQLDELYAVIRTLKAGEMREDDALERLKPARPWVGHGPWRWPSGWCTTSLVSEPQSVCPPGSVTDSQADMRVRGLKTRCEW
jgi:hypothetical protein